MSQLNAKILAIEVKNNYDEIKGNYENAHIIKTEQQFDYSKWEHIQNEDSFELFLETPLSIGQNPVYTTDMVTNLKYDNGLSGEQRIIFAFLLTSAYLCFKDSQSHVGPTIAFTFF